MSYLNEKPFQFWVFVAIGLVLALWLFHPVLSPFVVGFAVAYLLNPLVEKLERRHIPRWLSALFILGIFFILMILGLLIAIPLLIREMIDFVQLLPSLFIAGQEWMGNKLPMIDLPKSFDDVRDIDPEVISERLGSVLNIGKDILGNIFQSGLAVIGVISFMALMPIVAFYLLIDWKRVGRAIESLIPQKNAGRIKSMISDIDRGLSGFIRGQLMVCAILGMFYAIALSVMGLDYGFFIGIASGLLSIIPYVGSIFGLVASVGMAFYQFGGWEYPLIALAIFIAGQLVEGNYLTPKLVGDSVGLHPLWIIFALLAGGMLLGLLGMIIAVPVAAIIAVLIRHGIDVYKSGSYYKGKK
jgi:predicted PurR-regulated permease PerM